MRPIGMKIGISFDVYRGKKKMSKFFLGNSRRRITVMERKKIPR